MFVEQTFLSAGGGTFQFRFGRLESRPTRRLESLRYVLRRDAILLFGSNDIESLSTSCIQKPLQ
jgi:hypothetical protein